MLLVKTKIGPSKIEGIGLFADQFIPKGTLVQKFIPGFDLVFESSYFEKLPKNIKEFSLKYTYKEKKNGVYILNSDNARFLNHSYSPNLISQSNFPEEIEVAARDIEKGEEITVNYEYFDADFNSYKETYKC